MMKAEVKFSVRDLVGDMRDGIYEIPDGSTVNALLEAAQNEVSKALSEEVKQSFVFLVNSRPAQWETIMHEGDKVRVLYKILGG